MIHILLISDLHLKSDGKEENQNQVINGFLEDLTKTLKVEDYCDNYCIIAGDLVNDGMGKSYEYFHKAIINPILRYMPLENIMVVAGNHDLNRNDVKEKEEAFEKYIRENSTEEKFNDLLYSDWGKGRLKFPFISKFKYFENYFRTSLKIPENGLFGYFLNPIPTLSICFINSAICSFGGLNGREDSNKLKVDTRIINKWIQSTKGRKRMLVMHHPVEDLEYEYQNEVTRLIESGVDVLINGHTHFEKISSVNVGNRIYLHFQSPQLFSSKTDCVNAYAVMHVSKKTGIIEEIDFRQWVDRRKCFSLGIDFSDDGKYRNLNSISTTSPDAFTRRYEREWKEDMEMYQMHPKWIERYLDEKCPKDQKQSEPGEDYINIINSDENYQICGTGQSGLTCFAKYLRLKVWNLKQQHWLYLDIKNVDSKQVDGFIARQLSQYELEESDVLGLLIDNWKPEHSHAQRIMDKITKRFPTRRIFLFVSSSEANIVSGLDNDLGINCKMLYLRTLSRKDVRGIVAEINSQKYLVEDDNVLLNRLLADIKDLNLHRYPYNCIQLLTAFTKNFEERPVNRSKIFDNILGALFENPGNLFYSSALPDVETCKFIVGYFCETLFRKDPISLQFTAEEFTATCNEFCQKEFHGTNPINILHTFQNNQLVICDNSGYLQFRFIAWVYYFVGDRMRRDENFYNFMLKERKALFNDEIVDFYTATDRARVNLVEVLTNQLIQLTTTVHNAIGLPEEKDPYANIKWGMNESLPGITVEELKQQVSQSNLPDEIKDVIADKDYDSSKPYFQTISTFLEKYFVRNLMVIIRTSSIALRNGEFVEAKYKKF